MKQYIQPDFNVFGGLFLKGLRQLKIDILFPVMKLSCLAIALSFSVCSILGAQWERKLVVKPANGVLLRAQGAGGAGRQPFRRIAQRGGDLNADYGFLNFNKDFLTFGYTVSLAALREYMGAFGYTDQDLAELKNWRNKVHETAYKNAVEKNYTQAAYDSMLKSIDREYEIRKKEFFASRGFTLSRDNVISVDIPSLVTSNRQRMNIVARELETVAQDRGYDSEDIVGAALALVQTGLLYKIPPSRDENGKYTGGVIPPVAALGEGWGDCDSKSALLGAVLSNWSGIKLVGVAVPGHYLMAICRNPGRGDLFVDYHGL
ncbi:MAG TPA: hypothetical protein PLL10_10675, partial [Elusimicrobiales bacterium]|nr:hypothetical protein [Elusimicrobiales bacterium]